MIGNAYILSAGEWGCFCVPIPKRFSLTDHSDSRPGKPSCVGGVCDGDKHSPRQGMKKPAHWDASCAEGHGAVMVSGA